MGLKGDGYMNYTYILKCRDNSLYTGWTNDIDKRLKAHNDGKSEKYNKSRRPVELIYYEKYETKEEAMKREYAIKHMTRRAKEELLRNGRAEKGTKQGIKGSIRPL